jgi:hypothetical protein
MGAVIKGNLISFDEAVEERRQGRDIVVCGGSLAGNMQFAALIEAKATGNRHQRHRWHDRAGAHALSHFQPKIRGLAGHSLYESPKERFAQEGAT